MVTPRAVVEITPVVVANLELRAARCLPAAARKDA